MFSSKCAGCEQSFSPDDYVMRAQSKIFHLHCFRCATCERELIQGDEFALRKDKIFCKAHRQGENVIEANNNLEKSLSSQRNEKNRTVEKTSLESIKSDDEGYDFDEEDDDDFINKMEPLGGKHIFKLP